MAFRHVAKPYKTCRKLMFLGVHFSGFSVFWRLGPPTRKNLDLADQTLIWQVKPWSGRSNLDLADQAFSKPWSGRSNLDLADQTLIWQIKLLRKTLIWQIKPWSGRINLDLADQTLIWQIKLLCMRPLANQLSLELGPPKYQEKHW